MGTALSDFTDNLRPFYRLHLCQFSTFCSLATASAAISAAHVIIITTAAAY